MLYNQRSNHSSNKSLKNNIISTRRPSRLQRWQHGKVFQFDHWDGQYYLNTLLFVQYLPEQDNEHM